LSHTRQKISHILPIVPPEAKLKTILFVATGCFIFTGTHNIYAQACCSPGTRLLSTMELAGTLWDVFGFVVDGKHEGKQLTQIESYTAYWFARAAFFPDGVIEPSGP
jgi:hypothetical protein